MSSSLDRSSGISVEREVSVSFGIHFIKTTQGNQPFQQKTRSERVRAGEWKTYSI